MTTLRTILTAHAASTPLVYLTDGATDWYAQSLLDALEYDSDDPEEVLDAQHEYVVTGDGIARIDESGYQRRIPDYRYRAAWNLADPAESAIAVPTLDALREAAQQFGDLDTDMPTYGGEEPNNTTGVWSWDETRLLVGTCAEDLRIISRQPSE